MFIFRIVFYFTLSFIIYSIPVGNNQNVFNLLQDKVSDYGNSAISIFVKKIHTTKKYSKKMFSNSQVPGFQDEINEKQASIKKKPKILHKAPDDTYSEEEQLRLKNVLNDQ